MIIIEDAEKLVGRMYRVALFARHTDDGREAGSVRLSRREVVEDVAHRPRKYTFNFGNLS